MADLSDVANKLVEIVAAALYPNGNGQPSITNSAIRVYQGWPNPQSLDADMAAGTAHVSIYPRPGDVVTSVMMGDTDWQEAVNNGTTGTSVREVRRQTKQFQASTWAPTPVLRDAIGKAVDLAFGLIGRMAMPDGTSANVAYVGTTQSDEQQKLTIYRRDLFVAVNYALLQTDAEYAILHTVTNVTAGPSVDVTGPEITVTSP